MKKSQHLSSCSRWLLRPARSGTCMPSTGLTAAEDLAHGRTDAGTTENKNEMYYVKYV